MRNAKAVNFPYASKETTFYVQLLVESLCILWKNTHCNCSSASGLFLSFHQISDLHSFKLVLIKKSVSEPAPLQPHWVFLFKGLKP